MLFRGYDDQPAHPGAKMPAGILWDKLFEKGNCSTNTFKWVKGDRTFYPEWGYFHVHQNSNAGRRQGGLWCSQDTEYAGRTV
ncbi:MAG: hypothetical protein MZV63_62165 [Marinilabiliales bacterium]|nr:hypothetical protein [Marinilabiliales bacterium]